MSAEQLRFMSKVIFHDGFFVSPTVLLCEPDLEIRIATALGLCLGSPAKACAYFVASQVLHSVIDKDLIGGERKPVPTVANTPTGRTFGATVVNLQSRAFWPDPEGNAAGVFFVNTETQVVSYWGGKGFVGDPELQPTMETQRPVNMELLRSKVADIDRPMFISAIERLGPPAKEPEG